MSNYFYKRFGKFIFTSLFLCVMIFTSVFLCSQELGFENESETDRISREERSIEMIKASLPKPTEFGSEYIPENVISIYYFREKMSLNMILNSPEFYNSRFFPYSSQIDKSFLGSYPTYYKVYYDIANRVMREDYFENKKFIYYILHFYEGYSNVRKRASYFTADEYNTVFDYFNFENDNARVEIKYLNNEIEFIKVEYKTNEGGITTIAQYNGLLQKHNVWYYYNEKVMLVKKEFWKNDKLVKYLTCGKDFERVYYDGDGKVISRKDFYGI